MNRSAKSLLSVSVFAAFALAAAPASAAPGPAVTVLYETAATAAPVTRMIPEPVTAAAGQVTEPATGAVDGVLRAAPAASGRRCTLNPGKTVESNTGASLPDAPLPSAGKSPLAGLPEGDCLDTGRRTGANPLPVPPDAAAAVPGTLTGSADQIGAGVRNTKLGGLPGMSALPGARRAQMPLSMGLPDVPGTLGTARPAGLPVGSTLFPPAGRHGRPVPPDDVLGQANTTVDKAGTGLDRTEDGVGRVVEVLKTRDRVATPADGPLSMPGAPGLGLPDAPGVGLPGLPGLG